MFSLHITVDVELGYSLCFSLRYCFVISLLRYVFLNLKTIVTMINNVQGQPLVILWNFGRPGLKSRAALPINI